MHFWSLVLVCVQPHLKPHKWWVNSNDGALAEGIVFFFNVKHFSSKKILCFCRLTHGDINTESEIFFFFFLSKMPSTTQATTVKFPGSSYEYLGAGEDHLGVGDDSSFRQPSQNLSWKKPFWFKVMEKSLIINLDWV